MVESGRSDEAGMKGFWMLKMRSLPAFLIATAVAGCNPSIPEPKAKPLISEGRPTKSEIDTIERALVKASDPCVGDLNRWVREYYYRYWNGGVDRRYIVIRLSLPEDGDRPQGRYSDYSVAVFRIDDRPVMYAYGILDKKRGSIDYWGCGRNVRKPGGPYVSIMDRPSILVE